MRTMRLAVLLATLLFCFAVPQSHASDISINPVGPVFPISPLLTWGVAGPGGFNNNFYFSPLNASESVCVYVYNKNTTSSHTFATKILVSANPGNTTPSDGTWNQAAVWTNMNAPVSPGVAANISASVSGAALVAVSFSGSSTQSGSPETAQVVITQTSGTCFSGQNTSGANTSPVNATKPIQVYSDSLSQSYEVAQLVGSPAMNAVINAVYCGNTCTKSAYFDKVVITNSSTTASYVYLQNIITTPTGCGSLTPSNLKSLSGNTSSMSAGSACTGGGSAASQVYILVPANEEVVFDMAGYIVPANSLGGIDLITPTAVTGTVTSNFFWYEK